jgi:hypothetical protein
VQLGQRQRRRHGGRRQVEHTKGFTGVDQGHLHTLVRVERWRDAGAQSSCLHEIGEITYKCSLVAENHKADRGVDLTEHPQAVRSLVWPQLRVDFSANLHYVRITAQAQKGCRNKRTYIVAEPIQS